MAAGGGSGGAPSARVNLLDAIKGMGVGKLRSKEESSVAAAKVRWG